MVSRSLTRLARNVSSSTSAGANQAGPSNLSRSATINSRDGSKAIKSPQSRRLPRPALRSLVSLHHASAAFMTSPTQVPSAFENAFNTDPPQFEPYRNFEERSLEAVSSSARTGGSDLISFSPTSGFGSSRSVHPHDDQRQRLPPRVFNRGQQAWSDGISSGRRGGGYGAGYGMDGNDDNGLWLSARQTAVKEALFGTWERAGSDAARPGLEGVEEWLAVRGMQVERSAEAWQGRDGDGEGRGNEGVSAGERAAKGGKSTEDGM